MVINVRYGEPKKLACPQSIFVSFGYKQAIVDTIRTITERYWNGRDKEWELAYEALNYLQERLPKEKFNIVGEPINNKKFGEKYVEKNYKLPKVLRTKLYSYQEEDFNECMNFDRYLLLHEQGTGKSLMAIAVALKRKELKQIKRCLIVCGVNTIKFNWQEEIKTHTGMDSVVLGARKNRNGIWQTKGTPEKLEDLETLEDSFFLITNIESLRCREIKDKIKKYLDKDEMGMIIFDEMHKCKAVSSQQGKAILLLSKHCKYFLGLTGTVLSNSPLDAYIPLRCVQREPANFTQFKSRYCIFGGFGNMCITGFSHLDELQAKLDSVSKRRLKSDVLDLPPKIYTDEYLEMGKKQAKLYSDVLKAVLDDIDNVALSLDPLGQLIRLRQVTAAPAILSNTIDESVKLDRLDELMADATGKVIIFSNWTSVTGIVQERLKQYNPAIITGQIRDRETQKHKFMEDDSCRCIICTTNAAGVGLTLTAADVVVFIDEPWSAAAKTQAEDRAYRIGTKSSVNIITLMCKGTIDEFIHRVVKKKQAMSDAIVDKKFDVRNQQVLKFLITGEGNLI